MSNTVRTLMLLARRPEEIEFEVLDCSALLWGIVCEMQGDGVLSIISASDAAEGPSAVQVAGSNETHYAEDRLVTPCNTGKKAVSGFPAPRQPVNLHVDITANVLARGQKELAGIVLNNLLDNACQYTENGRAKITLSQGELRVRNQGSIPAGVDVFARGVRCTQKTGNGAGLGLSLALRACERLGWRLDLLSGPTDGDAVFCVKFSPISQGVDI